MYVANYVMETVLFLKYYQIDSLSFKFDSMLGMKKI